MGQSPLAFIANAFSGAITGGRIDQQKALCIHDWAVPPPEEMLSIHLCLSLPGREAELLHLAELENVPVEPWYQGVL